MVTKSILMKYALSPSADVATYRLRIVPTGAQVTLASEYDDIGTTGEVDISSIEKMANADGVFDFYLTAVDDAGNESQFSVFTGQAIDFLAPEPPGAITFDIVSSS